MNNVLALVIGAGIYPNRNGIPYSQNNAPDEEITFLVLSQIVLKTLLF